MIESEKTHTTAHTVLTAILDDDSTAAVEALRTMTPRQLERLSNACQTIEEICTSVFWTQYKGVMP